MGRAFAHPTTVYVYGGKFRDFFLKLPNFSARNFKKFYIILTIKKFYFKIFRLVTFFGVAFNCGEFALIKIEVIYRMFND